MAGTPATVDDYFASFPADTRRALEEARSTIRAAVPDAEEAISYGIPTFRLGRRYLVYLAGWKDHLSVYPVPGGDEAYRRAIAPYRSGKGTLRFPLAGPIPHELVRRTVELLLAERSA